MSRALVAAAAVFMLVLAGAGRQPAAGGAEMQAADAAFQKESWQEAADHYKAAQAAGLDHALLHFRYGYSLHMLKKYDEALPHHLKAATITNKALKIDALYNCACAYALLGKRAEALKYFQYAVDAGFGDADHLNSDSDMDSLREDPEFIRIASTIGQTRLSEAMDFFLGTWDSRDDKGTVTQTYTLARPLPKSSGITTVITNIGGGQWTGLLMPSTKDRTWVWSQIGDADTSITLVGTPLGHGVIRFEGYYESAGGKGATIRLTYTPGEDGSVTEKAEVAEPDGSWHQHHEERFTRKPAAEPQTR